MSGRWLEVPNERPAKQPEFSRSDAAWDSIFAPYQKKQPGRTASVGLH
jgi:hypothetical protein